MQKSQINDETGYLASQGVMGALHISRRTLERYVSDGKLTPVYLPSGHRRFSSADVAALLTPTSPVESAFPGQTSAGASVVEQGAA